MDGLAAYAFAHFSPVGARSSNGIPSRLFDHCIATTEISVRAPLFLVHSHTDFVNARSSHGVKRVEDSRVVHLDARLHSQHLSSRIDSERLSYLQDQRSLVCQFRDFLQQHLQWQCVRSQCFTPCQGSRVINKHPRIRNRDMRAPPCKRLDAR